MLDECKECHEPYKKTQSSQKYCSLKCRAKNFYDKYRKLDYKIWQEYDDTCNKCGGFADDEDFKTCSKCRGYYHERKRRKINEVECCLCLKIEPAKGRNNRITCDDCKSKNYTIDEKVEIRYQNSLRGYVPL